MPDCVRVRTESVPAAFGTTRIAAGSPVCPPGSLQGITQSFLSGSPRMRRLPRRHGSASFSPAWFSRELPSDMEAGYPCWSGRPFTCSILSFVNVGQTFYAFGWESILLEACFFAMFLGSNQTIPQQIPIWLMRWLLFRVMFGAGLIKLRGDPCWHNLTCLDWHFETQPMPNPLSWYLHWAPEWSHKAGVLFNHFSELMVPFGYFLPQPIATIAGLITIAFQVFIMASGNLSWLNFLTIILAIPTLDDRLLSHLLPLKTPMSRCLPCEAKRMRRSASRL